MLLRRDPIFNHRLALVAWCIDDPLDQAKLASNYFQAYIWGWAFLTDQMMARRGATG
ncbi:MAG: hypothetical protein ACRCR1_13755 [Aeromonas sp.]